MIASIFFIYFLVLNFACPANHKLADAGKAAGVPTPQPDGRENSFTLFRRRLIRIIFCGRRPGRFPVLLFIHLKKYSPEGKDTASPKKWVELAEPGVVVFQLRRPHPPQRSAASWPFVTVALPRGI
jgi:hypothetical protein